jgi:hypothetical protein
VYENTPIVSKALVRDIDLNVEGSVVFKAAIHWLIDPVTSIKNNK